MTYYKRRGLSWKHLQHAGFLPNVILSIGWYCVCWPTKRLWSFVSMHGHIDEEYRMFRAAFTSRFHTVAQ
jgi:hypothetical protein